MENLQELLDSHRDWLYGNGGKQLILRDVDLQWADLRSADLQLVCLRSANLQDTELQGASLQNADLRGADLRGADLRGANLRNTNLQGANLKGAIGIVGFSSSSDGWDVYGVLHGTGDERVVFIKAGCRWFTAADARKHWIATRGGTALGEERIAIVNFLESMLLNRSKEWK